MKTMKRTIKFFFKNEKAIMDVIAILMATCLAISQSKSRNGR